MARVEEQASALAEQQEEAARELAELREEYARECNLRKRLEKAAAADEKQIKSLQDALAKAEEVSAARSVDEQLSLERDRRAGVAQCRIAGAEAALHAGEKRA